MEILAVCDGYIRRDHFEEALGDLRSDHEVRIIKLDEERIWEGPEEPIREYWGSPEQIIDNINGVDFLLVHAAPVTSDVIREGSDLKLLGCCRGGPVNVDIEAATEECVPVVNAPGRNANAVAELALSFILDLPRKVTENCLRLKSGKLKSESEWYGGTEVKGKILGLVGLGNIGLLVADKARALGMHIRGYDPYVSEEKASERVIELVSLEELMEKSDFVSLHVRHTEETEGMIGSNELSMMKEGAYFVNTSRGEVVDQDALLKALREGKLGGAALDVFEVFGDYPVAPADYFDIEDVTEAEIVEANLENLVLTPHIGGMTAEVRVRSPKILVEEIERFLIGEELKNVVNPEIL